MARTTTSAKAWAPDLSEVAPIDAVPDALVMQTATIAGDVEGDAVAVRVMYVDDAEAAFVAEGDPITEAAPDLSEALVYTGKVAQLLRLSREQFGQPNASALLSTSVARAVTMAANRAYIAQEAPTAPAVTPPAGLLHVEGIQGADGSIIVADNLDALIDLQTAIGEADGTPTHLVLSPSAWASLRKIKDRADSNTSLLGAGTVDAAPSLLNLPVLVSNAVPADTGLMLDKTAIVAAVGMVNVAQSQDAFFSADSIALRCTWRFGATVVHTDRLGMFTVENLADK